MPDTKMSNLKTFRIKNRIRQVELAKLTGIHASGLSLIENGWRKLRKKDADLIVKAYKKMNIYSEELAICLIKDMEDNAI